LALVAVTACSGEDDPAQEVADEPVAVDAPGDEGVAATGHDVPVAAGRLTVVFTNNIDGEIEPCG